MKYLRVKNWEKFQHQSTKPLPWIKFFTALLAPTKEVSYSELADAQKALLHHIWLMARVHNGRIPETWLTREKLNLKSRVNLSPLLDAGYIWFETENGSLYAGAPARDAHSGLSKSDSSGFDSEGVQGEIGSMPDFAAVERLVRKLDTSKLRTFPPQQIVVSWVTDFGEELIAETLADCESRYAGKNYQYLEAILVSRRDNPDERPGNRRKPRPDSGRTGTGSEAPRRPAEGPKFGMRSAADLLAERKVHPVSPAAAGGSNDPVQ